jgi:hypothetical protein
MSDYYSIQEVGGAELARHYPDRGVIPDFEYHKAVLAPLPRRFPPGRMYWPKPWAIGVLVGFMLAAAVV